MAAITYASPGVYVEEMNTGPQPIQATGTSTAAFVGITTQASIKETNPDTGTTLLDSNGNPVVKESRLRKPTLVSSWTQFTKIFGEFKDGIYLPDAVYGHFSNGGGVCYVVSLRALGEAADGVVAKKASISIDANKGRTASFTVTAKTPGTSGDSLVVEIEAGSDDTFNMKIGRENKTGLTMSGTNSLAATSFRTVDITNIGSEIPKPGKYTLAGGVDAPAAAVSTSIEPLTVDDFTGDIDDRTGLGGLLAEDGVRLLACPDIMAGYGGTPDDITRVKTIYQTIVGHCEEAKYRFAVLDTPPKLNAQQAKDWRDTMNIDSSHAALYYPWIEVADYSDSGATSRFIPPSGHIVGLYNRTDAERGVHKSPANDNLFGVIGLEFNVSRGEQDYLNPIGVNCIRTFPTSGIKVWGARTLSATDTAWRYINVRRLFIMVESSLEEGMAWVVFEPNDRMLWAKVRRDVNSFLSTVWRSGALFGDTADEAFYVKCDDELNPPEVRDLGQLIIEIGLSPVKPAEFVIFRVAQWAGPNAEEA